MRVAPTVILAIALPWVAARDDGPQSAHPAMALEELARTRLRSEAESAEAYVRAAQTSAEDRVKKMIGEQVDQAHQILSAQWRGLTAHGVAPSSVAELLRESLRDARFFNGRGYYFIDRLDGLCILLPTAPSLEGSSLWDNRDDQGTYIMRRLVDAALQPEGGGYVHYRWYNPRSPERMSDKIAYVRLFKPLNWVVGAGEYTAVMEDTLQSEALARLQGIRFQGVSGGIGVIDAAGRPLLFPESRRHVQGMASDQGALSEAEEAMIQAIRKQARSGGGTMIYDWTDTETGRMGQRAAFVQPFTTWGWTIYASASAPTTAEASKRHSDFVPLLAWLALAVVAATIVLTRPREDMP